jgi:Zn-dependent protease
MSTTVDRDASAVSSCASCGSEIAAGLVACPGCHRLIHAGELKRLIARAAAASASSNRGEELSAWRSALLLLPQGSKQHTAIAAKLASLEPDAAPHESVQRSEPRSRFWKWIVGLGPVGLLLFKLKFVFMALLGNLKFLLLGLTKAGTMFSMLLAFGVYWTAWGMWFALGFVLSIYVHEMGHVVALRRYGIRATAPMFIPGLGAFIRLRQASLPAFQNARVGLAGPWWGLGAAVAALAASRLGGGPMWSAIAHTGAWLNLFNLLPVWQLDGNRGFSALGRGPRLSIAIAFGGAWLFTSDGLLALLAIVTIARALDHAAPDQNDTGVWFQFVALIVVLAIVLRVSATV